VGFAGRAAAGWARRLAGGDRDEIAAELAMRNADQIFAVLGELKGGAMKFGQALSVYEAMIPNELAEPYQEALIKLQANAPKMPAKDVQRVLAEQLGRNWSQRFAQFDADANSSGRATTSDEHIWKGAFGDVTHRAIAGQKQSIDFRMSLLRRRAASGRIV